MNATSGTVSDSRRPPNKVEQPGVGPSRLVAVTDVGGMPVRSVSTRPANRVPGVVDPSTPLVVVLPGLGMTRYVGRLTRELATRGATAVLLDLPGFGSPRQPATTPDIHAVGHAAARWVDRCAADRPLVMFGHSTGAQAALTATLYLHGHCTRLGLVLAGPTFAPGQRTLPGVLARTPLAYRHDAPWQLDPRELVRAGPSALLALAKSGQRDQLEGRIRPLRVPCTVTAGHHDSYAPESWLELLCHSLVASPAVRCAVIGGSHNNPWTHPADLASLTMEAASSIGCT